MSFSFLSRFGRARRGNVAVFMAVSALPIALMAGFSIDTARQVKTKQRLVAAVDATILAGTRRQAKTNSFDRAIDTVYKTFSANMSGNAKDTQCRVYRIAYNNSSKKFWVSAECKLPTTLGANISGKAEMTVRVSAEAKASVTSLDLALVLDTSVSMGTTKMAALKEAANQLVEDLVDPAKDYVRISIVPYNGSVNAGAYGNVALGRAAGDDSDGDGLDDVCISERAGGEAFTDAKPAAGAYVEPKTIYASSCYSAPILPLTNNKSKLQGLINGLTSGGYTGGHIALGWGWYTISPNWTDVWPASAKPMNYGNPDEIKAVVLMSDGSFNGTDANSLGDPDEQAKKMCLAMRAQGVIVFSIAFQITDADALALMQDCASSSSYYYDAADKDELKAAFEAISSKFQGVGLTG